MAIESGKLGQLKDALGQFDEATRRELLGLVAEKAEDTEGVQETVKALVDARMAEEKAAREAAEKRASDLERERDQAVLAAEQAKAHEVRKVQFGQDGNAGLEDSVGGRYDGRYHGPRLAEQVGIDTLIDTPADEFGNFKHAVEDLQRLNDDFLLIQQMQAAANKGTLSRPLTRDPRFKAAWMENKALRSDVDKLLGKALYSTGSTVGDEWVPNNLSAQFVGKVWEGSKFAGLFPRLQMRSDTDYWPIYAGQSATAYLAAESAQDSDVPFTASNVTTAKLTMTCKKFVVRTLYSEEFADDSVAGSVERVKEDIANSGAFYWDRAILDGDTTSTSFDTGVSRAANDVRRAWDGLRHWALVTLASAGVNTNASAAATTSYSCANAVLDALANMGIYMGDNPVGICSYKMGKRLGLLRDNQNQMVNAPYAEGAATRIAPNAFLGTPIIPTKHMLDTLNASGIYDGSTTSYTEILWVNRDAFFVGDRRDWRLDTRYDIDTGQWVVVLSWRGGFGTPYSAATEYIATVCYGIYSS